MNVHIIFTGYLNDDKTGRSVGGVQTYIYNLTKVIMDMGSVPIIYYANNKTDGKISEIIYEGVKVITFNCPKSKVGKRAILMIPPKEMIIFASEELVEKYDGKILAIQHGIYWDKPEQSNYNKFFVWRRALRAYRILKRINISNEIVCVDCNFINWYRTQVAYPDCRLTYIPNFSNIPTVCRKPVDIINIIFARRYVEFRGTRVFAKTISRILKQRENIKVIFAGEGPDEEYLKNKFRKENRVVFTRYESAQSLKIHEKMHIAVVPTIGSEGTSLSLLEAMASQCAVVCSNVGGMTNILLDKHNGLLVSAADDGELYDAILLLIDDENLRRKLAMKGYETVKDTFSYEIWKSKWENVLRKYL